MKDAPAGLSRVDPGRRGPTLSWSKPLFLLAMLIQVQLAFAQGPPPAPVPELFVPFLIGRSHPDLPRLAPSPTELGAIDFQLRELARALNPPSALALSELQSRTLEAMKERRLGHRDASLMGLKIRDVLNSRSLDRSMLDELLASINAQLRDTAIGHTERHRMVRDVRDVVASAINELPWAQR